MSDNISPDEIKRRLVIFLSIPAEVWTDVLKLFSRRILIKNIAPACFRLKEICDKNVKSIHVIENATQFTDKLEEDNPEANQQLENLAANECQLSNQFQLANLWISENSKAILSDCPDLFNGCQITLIFKEENKDSTLFVECLDQLEKAKPVVISASQRVDQIIDYWHHPTILNCSRVRLFFWMGLSAAAVMNVFDWLHHQPNGVDCDGSDDQQVRGMIVCLIGTGQNHIDWLINRCSEDIQQAQDPADHRSFVLSFACFDWTGFGQFHRIENKSTGEVLVLDPVINVNPEPIRNAYRLRRCLVEEEANGPEFYAGTFKRMYGFDVFKIGDETPKVVIE